jgi:hypothetical protein
MAAFCSATTGCHKRGDPSRSRVLGHGLVIGIDLFRFKRNQLHDSKARGFPDVYIRKFEAAKPVCFL